MAPTARGVELGHARTSSAELLRRAPVAGAVVVAGIVVAGAIVPGAVEVAGAVVAAAVVGATVAGASVDDASPSAGRSLATFASARVVGPAASVRPRTLACAPDSVAPGTTAMATAEATAKGSSARAPFRIQSGTYQEEHK